MAFNKKDIPGVGLSQGASGGTPKPVSEQIKQDLAKGTGPGALGIKFELLVKEMKDKKKQMFIEYHDLISMNGILSQETSQQDYQYTNNYSYDPIRSSLGAVWIKKGLHTGPRYASPKPSGQKLSDSSVDTGKKLKQLNVASDRSFCHEVLPLVRYKFHTRYKNNGITNIKLSAPGTTNSSNEEETPFKSKLLNIGTVQYMFLYFDMADYSDSMAKLVPFNLFFDTRQKLEGYVFQANTDTGFQTMEFDATSGPRRYDSMFITPSSTEDELLSEGVIIDELGNYQIGQGKIISDIQDKIFSDHTIQSQHAISEEALPFFGNETLQGNLIADVKPIYNYFLAEWEYATPVLKEQALPSVYHAAHLEQEGKMDEWGSKFKFRAFANKLINCDVEPDEYNKAWLARINNNVVISPDRRYMEMVEDMKSQFPMYNEITFKPIPPGEISNSLRESGITVDFLKTQLSYVHSDYSDNSMENMFGVLARMIMLASSDPKILEGKDATIISRLKDPASLNMFEEAEEYIVSESSLKCYDFLSWLEWYFTELDDPPSGDDMKLYDKNLYKKWSKFYGSSEFKDLIDESNTNSFNKAIGLIKFMSRFVEQVQARSRTLDKIYSGTDRHFADTDILYYRIEKRSSTSGEVLQNFFVLPEELDVDKGYSPQMKIIDTSVKYGADYTYEIFATKIIIGTEYRYNMAPTKEEEEEFETVTADHVAMDGQAIFAPVVSLHENKNTGRKTRMFSLYDEGEDFNQTSKYVLPVKVNLRPTVKIYECPLYKETGVIITDNPPLPPIVNMYPLSGKRNKVLMTLETQTGDRNLPPVAIESSDTQYFILERFAQKRQIQYPSGDYIYENLRFKADDDSSVYEIYRLEGEENRPREYSDFRGKLHKTLDKMSPVPEGGFEDDIATNTKYYYTFRSKDMHGNISNPSHVYEVEMVDLGQDVFYPVFNAYEIQEIKTQDISADREKIVTKSKSLKKRIQIRAAEQQILLNEELSGITGETANVPDQDIVLGVADKSLWNDKKFKFRFTSRHTGRVIDLNVDFNYSTEKQKEEVVEACFDPKGE